MHLLKNFVKLTRRKGRNLYIDCDIELEIEWKYPLTQLNIPDGNTWHLVCVVVRNMERVNFFLRGCEGR